MATIIDESDLLEILETVRQGVHFAQRGGWIYMSTAIDGEPIGESISQEFMTLRGAADAEAEARGDTRTSDQRLSDEYTAAYGAPLELEL